MMFMWPLLGSSLFLMDVNRRDIAGEQVFQAVKVALLPQAADDEREIAIGLGDHVRRQRLLLFAAPFRSRRLMRSSSRSSVLFESLHSFFHSSEALPD
ncbi:MAG: hypothetical protein U0935_20405 [Pirellulales bacterium]